MICTKMETDSCEQKLQALQRDNSTSSPPFAKDYFDAQILCCQGDFPGAAALLAKAYLAAKPVYRTFDYERLFENIGTLYVQILDYLGNVAECERVFSDLLGCNPSGIFICDYAVFLHRRKRDYELAQTYYEKAVAEYSEYSSVHLKYAGFLRHVKKDITGAERHYLLAVETNPLSAEAVGNYASFLHGSKGNIDLAEEYYKRAFDIDRTHANNLCNHGLFLSEERGQYAEAEKLYCEALTTTPNHANTLYNYAVMLDTHCQRKGEAEELYRKALEVEPSHTYALYNLAVLLEDKYVHLATTRRSGNSGGNPTEDEKLKWAAEDNENNKEVCGFYKRAMEADPRDATTVADYGRFLAVKMEDTPLAEEILMLAIKLNPSSDIALYNLAVLKCKKKSDLVAAESLFRRLLSVKPTHAAGLQQLARLLIDAYKTATIEVVHSATAIKPTLDPTGKIEEALDLYEKIFPLQRDPSPVVLEYLRVTSTYGSEKLKLRAIKKVEQLLQPSSEKRLFARASEIGQMLVTMQQVVAGTNS